MTGRDRSAGHDQRSPLAEPAETERGSSGGVVGLIFDVVVPTAVYYGLRSLGVGIYLALIAGALASGLGAAVRLLRSRRLDRLAIFVMTTMLVSLGVSLVAGSPRFLLAKEGWLTGITGLWFLVSIRGRHPLALSFSRPLLEGRFGWPDDWDDVWERVPGFRRIWRVSSVIFGVGMLLDAALRVVMAYTLPVDTVPALGTALYGGTTVVVVVITNVYCLASGAANRHSAFYDPLDRITVGPATVR